MTNINKTCYITLYGKAYLSKGIIINDLFLIEFSIITEIV